MHFRMFSHIPGCYLQDINSATLLVVTTKNVSNCCQTSPESLAESQTRGQVTPKNLVRFIVVNKNPL